MRPSLLILLIFSEGTLSFRNMLRHHGDISLSMPEGPTSREVSENMFMQYRDHFSVDTTKWEQRYFVNTEFFDPNTTTSAFLYIGGESRTSSSGISSSTTYEAGKRNNGIMFVLEHRFYGLSQPFDDISTENLKYLSSQQALADLANFIVGMNEQYNLREDLRWVVIGGSYSGTLSAWMRLKYPHLVYASVASSAPLHAQLRFPEYLEVVVNDLARESDQCVQTVTTAMNQLDDVLNGIQQVENFTGIFNLCDDIEATSITGLDKENFYEYVIDTFAYVVQSHLANPDTHAACEIMADESLGSELQRLGSLVLAVNGNSCFNAYYENFLEELKNVTININGMMRQWWYQTCSEFAWYQISNSSNSVFKERITMNYFSNLCSDLYGAQFNEEFIETQTERTNTEFGGYEISATNIIFVHGGLDPWHPMGVVESLTTDYVAIFLDDETHCSDLYAQSDKDSQQLIAAREEIQVLLNNWLSVRSSAVNIGVFDLTFYTIMSYVLYRISA